MIYLLKFQDVHKYVSVNFQNLTDLPLKYMGTSPDFMGVPEAQLIKHPPAELGPCSSVGKALAY